MSMSLYYELISSTLTHEHTALAMYPVKVAVGAYSSRSLIVDSDLHLPTWHNQLLVAGKLGSRGNILARPSSQGELIFLQSQSQLCSRDTRLAQILQRILHNIIHIYSSHSARTQPPSSMAPPSRRLRSATLANPPSRPPQRCRQLAQ
jgi:hypothetical protein